MALTTYLVDDFKIIKYCKVNVLNNLIRSDSMVSVSYKTLVEYIHEDNYDDFCTFLNNKRVIVDDRDENGATALHFASSCGKLRFVRELLNHGADPNIPDCDNWCPLGLAAKEGFTDVCLALIDHNAELEHKDIGSWTALIWACYKGREDTVTALVNRGADVNASGVHHVTALMWATGRGHTNIAKFLVSKGAKVTMRDKFGTTALIWAARKGDLEAAKCYLERGANIDASGMYCWTPLIVAAMGNHVEVVEFLIERKANVNCTDKDGCSALTIACREGYYDVAIALLDAGAYINIQDKTRDSNLIYAVKNGHRSITEALLKRYADVNIVGKDNKTAVFYAVEKGNHAILKLLLDAKPDLEIPAKDGDTPMLRAVRYHNYQAVKMLQEAGAKVDVRDKRGDNPLHIAIRARSKTITELLISDVRNAHLLNCPNSVGETPYQIDYDDEKPVMHQIYGARAMNSNAENENSLGYDLYSCALAAILSEPDISMPITIGLYAKWGSGKSFLLNKVKEELKNFSRQWLFPMFEFQWLLSIIIMHLTFFMGIATFLITKEWIYGVYAFSCTTLFFYCWLLLIYYFGTKINFLYTINLMITQKMNCIRLILQIIFCHPPNQASSRSSAVVPIKYYFANQSKVTTTSAGENTVVNIIGSLFDAIENDHGTFPTRLYRAFTPKPAKRQASWAWRRLCCIPSIVLFELNLVSIILLGITLFLQNGIEIFGEFYTETTRNAAIAACAVFIAFCVVSNMYTFAHTFKALMFPQRKHLQKAVANLPNIKSAGFMEALKAEVQLMINMIRCLDGFSKQQSRMVVIIDGLDSCEQDKVLMVLDTVNVLFSEADTPFITFLSIDPFIISKMIEVNSRKLLSETNIGGHDYLRNLVQLPFYLQNSSLRKVKIAQKCSHYQRKSFSNQMLERSDDHVVNRRMSNESGVSSNEKLKVPSSGAGLSALSRNAKGGSRKLKLSDSVASSIASNLNRMGGAQDLTHMLCSDDYFSEINPRSMRRLMNVACVTGRLLKSFQIDFNWYHLASWVNITEQWPYRTTCIILYHDAHEDSLDDSVPLKTVYDKIRNQLPISKEVEPLLEFDRDEKKFNIFLKYHRSSLQVANLRIFLPFTINLDPHIKKVIKEKQQKFEDTTMMAYNGGGDFGLPWLTDNNTQSQPVLNDNPWCNMRKPPFMRREPRVPYKPTINSVLHQPSIPQPFMPTPSPWSGINPAMPAPYVNPINPTGWMFDPVPKSYCAPIASSFIMDKEDLSNVKLVTLSVDGACDLLKNMKELQNSPHLEKYIATIRKNNITGSVLFYCDLDDLKKTMDMTFGDWELFKVLILSLREQQFLHPDPEDTKNVKFHQNVQHQPPSSALERKGSHSKSTTVLNQDQTDNKSRQNSKQSETEKQVTMEDQLICGALQTLNEEACEDVLEETEDTKPKAPILTLPESDADWNEEDEEEELKAIENEKKMNLETDAIVLQSSPVGPSWSPVCTIQNWFTNDIIISNTTDSACSTPTLIRRKSSDRESSCASKCRPSSLLIAKPEDMEEILTLDERKAAHASVIRSCSVDDTNLRRGTYTNLLVDNNDKPQSSLAAPLNGTMPVLTITPALSGSVDDTDDDENTPLVSYTSSPNCGPFRSDNKREVNTKALSSIDLQSPSSVPSSETQETHFHSSTDSLHRTNQETFCSFSYVNERNYKGNTVDNNVKKMFRTNSSGSISEAKYKWSDSETTV
ncbi:kinase D-interacting substrate of 220 kDa B isoform X2 [Planococcus citri]|uniref:kinase D-interacting substrate of 220 kDa B isoform X2 n=1 Tax=Planococcus citri TaxID=170843 RepID=UPI0031F884A0